MKKTIYHICALVAILATPAAATLLAHTVIDRQIDKLTERTIAVSWEEYCKYAGIDIHDDSPENTARYLDTWCGSTLEEEALIAAGIYR